MFTPLRRCAAGGGGRALPDDEEGKLRSRSGRSRTSAAAGGAEAPLLPLGVPMEPGYTPWAVPREFALPGDIPSLEARERFGALCA